MLPILRKFLFAGVSSVTAFTMLANTAIASTVTLIPKIDGATLEWAAVGVLKSPPHYSVVDEETCNNNTDFLQISIPLLGTKTDILGFTSSTLLVGSTVTGLHIDACVYRVSLSGNAQFTATARFVETNTGSSTNVGTTYFQWNTSGWQTINGANMATNYNITWNTRLYVDLVAHYPEATFRVSKIKAVLSY